MDEEVVLVEELHAFQDAPRNVSRRELMKVVGKADFRYSLNARRQEWLQNIMCSERTTAITPLQNSKLSINKVPQMLREIENFSKYYEPTVVSMGPYHNGNTRLRKMEGLKPIISRRFLEKSGYTEGFFDRFAEKIKGVKECYDKDLTKNFDDEAFTQMMFLDGCFILYFICCIRHYGVKILGMKNQDIVSVQQDMFLLENQLPFQVLKVLMSLSDSIGRNMLDTFIDLNAIGRFTLTESKQIQEVEPLHLLDLFRKKLLGRASRRNEKHNHNDQRHEKVQIKAHLFCNVKELKAAGIRLRPNTTGNLRDINFRSCGIWGTLTLPHMTIDSSTRSIFLNLTAYERCMDNPNEYWITSYLCFLDLLIDHADDVKELRTAGIIDNFLGSDEDVVKLLKEIADDLVPNSDTFEDVKLQIQDYFRHKKGMKIALWVAEVHRNHFKSPWTIIAILAGFIAIFLTSVQIYFTDLPRYS